MGKKAVILGWYGHDNLGDELLLDSTLKFFGKRFNYFKYQSPVNLGKDNAINFTLESKTDLIKLIFNVILSDAIILGGGSYMRDLSSKNSLRVKLIVLFFAIITFKPIYFFGSGLGPYSFNRHSKLLKFVYSKVKFPAVRDKKSAQLYKEICGKDALIVPDSVIWYLSEIKVDPITNGKIGFALREWHDKNMLESTSSEYESFIKELAEYINNSQNESQSLAIVFQNSLSDKFSCDQKIYLDANKLITSKENNFNLKELTPDLKELVATYSEVEVIVGMRLHSLVIGAIFGKKLIAISYDPKVRSFMESIGLGEFVIEFEEFNANKLSELIAKLDKQKYNLLQNHKEGLDILNKEYSPIS